MPGFATIVFTDEITMYILCYFVSVLSSVVRQMHNAKERNRAVSRGQVGWGALHSGFIAMTVILSINYNMKIPPIGNFAAAFGIGIGGTKSFNPIVRLSVDYFRYLLKETSDGQRRDQHPDDGHR